MGEVEKVGEILCWCAVIYLSLSLMFNIKRPMITTPIPIHCIVEIFSL